MHNYIIKILLGLQSVILLFHLLVVLQIIPFHLVWGGRLQNAADMYIMESVSIVVNVIFMVVLYLRLRKFQHRIIPITLWLFFIIFLLNTIGNLLAVTAFERGFALVTFVLALLLLIILLPQKKKN
jgi:hypothetical protein